MLYRLMLTTALLFACCAAAWAQDEAAPAQPDEIALFVQEAIPEGMDREAAEAALRDAGDNWGELAAAIEGCSGNQADLADMLWLLQNAPHLDRLELRGSMLLENLEMAKAWCGDGGYVQGSEFFRRYILNYRIDDEPVTNWRPELFARYAATQLAVMPPEQAAGQLVERVAEGFRTVERGYFGNLADPVAVDNARAGTARELSLLCAAALRSQGWATRFTRENMTGTSWVEVYGGDRAEYDAEAWFPVYPQAPEFSGMPGHAVSLCGGSIAVVTAGDAFGREQVTGRYSNLGGVQPEFFRDGRALPDFEHWTITAWHEGDYVPLDDLGYPTADADYPLTLGPGAEDTSGDTYYLGAPGDYRLQAGQRYPGGTVQVLTRDFSINPGDLLELELDIATPLDLPDEALREKAIAAEIPEQFAWLMEGTHLFFVYDDAEPSVRTALLVQEFDRRDDISFHSVEWSDRPEGWEKPEDYEPELERDVLRIADGDEKPVVVLLVDGELRIYLRGYNLNVADWIRRQLGEGGDAGDATDGAA